MKFNEAEIKKLVANAVKYGWARYPVDSPANTAQPEQPVQQVSVETSSVEVPPPETPIT